MSETVEHLGQEWCNPEKLKVKGNKYITQETTEGVIVLCAVERWHKYAREGGRFSGSGGIRYRPLKYEDLQKTSTCS